MKLKCKILLSSLFALSFVFIIQGAQAQHKRPVAKKKIVQHRKAHAVKHHKVNMAHTYRVMKRTNKVIIVANNHVKRNKVYTGALAKAVHHQRFAKKLLKMHKAHRAMQHSRIARLHAFKAIKSNKGTINKEWQFDDEENKTMGDNITEAELEKELKDTDPTISFKDENVSNKDMSDLEVIETNPSDYKNE